MSNPYLSIVKRGPLNARPDQMVEYGISVVNLGGSSAYNVKVSDRLPAGVTYVSASPTPASYGGGWVDWTIPEISAGQTVTFTLRVNMTIYPTTCQLAINNVTVVWGDTLGRTYGPEWDAFTTRVCSLPLLIIDKAGDTKGMKGQTLGFTINVTNVGGSDATNVKVWDDLPYNLTLITSNPPETSYDIYTGRIIWELDTIEPGETISISLTVNVSDVEYDGVWVFNNVYVNWTSEEGTPYGPITDIHPIQLFVKPYAEISKSGPAEAYAGSIIAYTITISNPTQTELDGVTLIDYLPARVSYVSSSPTGTYNGVTHTVTWSPLSLGPGGTLTFQITVRIDSDLSEGALIVDEAIVAWPAGSETDVSVTEILALPEPLPVGGTIVDGNISQIIAAIMIVTAATATTIAAGLKRPQIKRIIPHP